MPPDFLVGPLSLVELPGVVELHLNAFPQFFLSFLGPGFLREFYAAFLVDPGALAFVARSEGGQLGGVVVGSLQPDGFYERLLRRRWWAFGWSSLAAVCRKPCIILRLFRALWYRGEAPAGPPRALLSSIAVAPEFQGRGVGAQLLRHWLEAVHARGALGCFLTTDALENDTVNAFYVRQGWKLESTYTTPESRCMNRYVLDFDGSPPINRPPTEHA